MLVSDTEEIHSLVAKVKKSDLISSVIKFQGQPVSFDDYFISKAILDTQGRKFVLKGGRQISKSMTMAMDMMGRCMGIPYYKMLYVAPIALQTRMFSTDRIQERINESDDFKDWWVDKNCIQNVSQKTFTNGSCMYFRAETQTDKIRGLSVNETRLDEIQSMNADNIPIIEQCTSGQKDVFKFYAGTALTPVNLLENFWLQSNQIVPVLICPDHPNDPNHLNVPSTDNIFEDGIRCKVCKAKLSVRHPYIYLYESKPDNRKVMNGFWIPQIVLPLHTENPDKWQELYYSYKTYDKAKFNNEIMGLSDGAGIIMVTEEDLMKCCQPAFKMWDKFYEFSGFGPMYCGIDWSVMSGQGTSSKSYTCISIGAWNYRTQRFTIVFMKKFLNTDHLAVLNELIEIIRRFRVQTICADWGSGHITNTLLERHLKQKVNQVMYTNNRMIIHYDSAAGYHKASRSLTLIETFKAMKGNLIHFFNWKEFDQFKSHILAEFAETVEDRYGNETLQFNHSPDNADDILHTINIMFNMFKYKENR